MTRHFRQFTGVAFALYNVYVLKVGGDFMYGRFDVTLLWVARARSTICSATRQR